MIEPRLKCNKMKFTISHVQSFFSLCQKIRLPKRQCFWFLLFPGTCEGDPSCEFCVFESRCHQRGLSSCRYPKRKCTNLCSLLTTCEACLSQSFCKWRTVEMKCFNKAHAFTQIFSGWWNQDVIITQQQNCTRDDNPPGLTYVASIQPANVDYPDFVSVLFETKYELPIIQNLDSHNMTTRLKGRLYPYINVKDAIDVSYYLLLKGSDLGTIFAVSETARSPNMVLQIWIWYFKLPFQFAFLKENCILWILLFSCIYTLAWYILEKKN